MEILIKDDDDIAKAHKRYNTFNQDDRLREIHESRMKWKRDYNEAIETAKEEGMEKGIKQGIEQGIEQGIKQIALKMLEEGLDVEYIAKLTNISKDKIMKLKNG